MAAVATPAWMREYRGDWRRPDLIAGLTLAVSLLPAGLADASLAGLPPEAGLYACRFSGPVFRFFCSSRPRVVTVTTALSLLTGAAIGAMSGGDPVRHAALAAALALMVAAIAGVARCESSLFYFNVEHVRDLQRTFAAPSIESRLAEPNGWVRDARRRADYGPLDDQGVSAAILSWRALRTA